MGTEEGIRNATRAYLTQYYPQSLSTIPEEVLQVNFQQYLLFDNHLNRNLTPDISLILCRLLTFYLSPSSLHIKKMVKYILLQKRKYNLFPTVESKCDKKASSDEN